MDGIYLLVLLAFGALTGALLALCAALGANPPPSGTDAVGRSSQPGTASHAATDRGL